MIVANPFAHYILIIQMLGRVAFNMSKQRVKLDDKGYLYYDGKDGRIYVGQKDMVNKGLFIIESEPKQDLRSLWGITKNNCDSCYGYGVWPDDLVPLIREEITWALSDECPECDSNNHLEYINANGDNTISLPWINIKSIGLHAAMERFKRSASCVELLDTQVTKIAQG